MSHNEAGEANMAEMAKHGGSRFRFPAPNPGIPACELCNIRQVTHYSLDASFLHLQIRILVLLPSLGGDKERIIIKRI